MQRGRLHLLIIPIAALIAVLPLILNGCSCGHDFDFHILNWLEAARQFSHGNLLPRWTYSPAWNAGEPRFVFYPPLSWTVGAILGLLFKWTWTPILYTWLILTAAGLALHRLARPFTTPSAALLAAVFYLVNPYTLFTAYERTAYAELLAAVLIPILLNAILRPSSRGPVTILGIATPVALLWLTNAPAAVMSCYALALLAALRLLVTPINPPLDPDTGIAIAQSRVGIFRSTTTGAFLGLGLAAYYILPAAAERHFVQIHMVILPGLRIQDNFLFHRTTAGITNPTALADAVAHDQVLLTASIIATLLLAFTAIALFFAFKLTFNPGAPPSQRYLWLRWASRNTQPLSSLDPKSPADLTNVNSTRKLLLAVTALTLTIAFLLTPLSLPLWRYIPELAFLQFPWRIVAILAAALSLTLAIALTRLTLSTKLTITVALILAATLTLPSYYLFNQPCDTEDSIATIVTNFQSHLGTEPTDEYTPNTADNDSITHSNPPYWLSLNPLAPAPTTTQPGPAPATFTLDVPIPLTLILNLRDYPAWHVTLNDALVITRQPRPDGLIAIPVPAGHSQIAITYTRLVDQTIAAAITLLSLTFFLILIILTLRHRRRARNSSPLSR